MLELDKFPVDDPYVRLLRRLPNALRDNPKTVERIARQVKPLSWPQLKGAIKAPIVANRRLGSRFSEWLGNLGYPVIGESDLQGADEGTSFLSGTDGIRKEFARRHLGYSGGKGLDFVAKRGGLYVIGEAKFFGDYGGNQNNQLRDAMGLVESQSSLSSNARAIAVLDGVVGIPSEGFMYKAVSSTGHDVMSALLLPEYLESLRQ
ncbi:hypothetical protein BH20ACT10_BH20ACT10_22860 [soil metagenome]